MLKLSRTCRLALNADSPRFKPSGAWYALAGRIQSVWRHELRFFATLTF